MNINNIFQTLSYSTIFITRNAGILTVGAALGTVITLIATRCLRPSAPSQQLPTTRIELPTGSVEPLRVEPQAGESSVSLTGPVSNGENKTNAPSRETEPQQGPADLTSHVNETQYEIPTSFSMTNPGRSTRASSYDDLVDRLLPIDVLKVGPELVHLLCQRKEADQLSLKMAGWIYHMLDTQTVRNFAYQALAFRREKEQPAPLPQHVRIVEHLEQLAQMLRQQTTCQPKNAVWEERRHRLGLELLLDFALTKESLPLDLVKGEVIDGPSIRLRCNSSKEIIDMRTPPPATAMIAPSWLENLALGQLRLWDQVLKGYSTHSTTNGYRDTDVTGDISIANLQEAIAQVMQQFEELAREDTALLDTYTVKVTNAIRQLDPIVNCAKGKKGSRILLAQEMARLFPITWPEGVNFDCSVADFSGLLVEPPSLEATCLTIKRCSSMRTTRTYTYYDILTKPFAEIRQELASCLAAG